MAAFDPITSVSGNQPSSLAGPNLNEAPPLDLVDQSAQIRQPLTDEARSQLVAQNERGPAPTEELSDDELEAMMSGQSTGGQISDEELEAQMAGGAPVESEPTMEEPDFQALTEQVGVVEAVKLKFNRNVDRARLGFAGNQKEKVIDLKKTHGEKNVRVKNGEIEFKFPGTGFVRFDPDSEEYQELLDHTRLAFEGLIEEGGQLAAGAMSLNPFVYAGSGTVTAPTALLAGDFVAEKILGIERDPDRNKAMELATAGAFGLGSGVLAAKIARTKLAKEQAQKLLSADDTANMVEEVTQNAEMLNESLAEHGVSLKQEGTDIILTPGQQLGPDAPEGGEFDFEISDNKKVRDFLNRQAERFTDAYGALIQSAANMTGKKADDLFGSVKAAAKYNVRLENAKIGNFRLQAKHASKGEARAVENTVAGAEDSLARFGGEEQMIRNPITSRMEKKTVFSEEALKDMYPDADKETRKKAADIVKRLAAQTKRGDGKLTFTQVDDAYTEMTSFITNNMDSKKNRKLATQMIDIKDRLRDDWTDIIGKELPEGSREAYQGALNQVTEMRNAGKQLKSLLTKDDFSAQTFASKLFKGDLGKGRLKQIRSLLEAESPELWDQLRNTYLSDIVARHRQVGEKARKSEIRLVNWANVKAEFATLRRNGVADELFDNDPKKINTFNAFLDVAARIDNFKFKSKKGSVKTFVGMMRTAIILGSQMSGIARISEGQRLVQDMGQGLAIKKFFAGEGASLLMDVAKSPKEKALFSKFLGELAKKGGRTATRQKVERFSPNLVDEEEQ